MLTIVVFILILGLLIFVHELGHFITAIRLGVKVEEFGLGFPPRLVSFKKKGVIYSLNWIPLGGFVKIKGEQGEDGDDPQSFAKQAAWKKLVIISAGVFMNFLLAFVFLSVAFYFGLPQVIDRDNISRPVSNPQVIIADIYPGSAAQEGGIEIGDQLMAIGGQSLDNSQAAHERIKSESGQAMDLLLLRKGEELSLSLEPRPIEDQGEPVLGIGMIDVGVIKYGFFESIWQGLRATVLMIGMVVSALYHLLANLISRGEVAAEFGGPVAVAVVTGQIVQMGWIYILQFVAILSINLGVINFFPFPALDGGRALFIVAQAIARRQLNQKVEAWIHNSGFIILIFLIILITFRDFGRYGGQMIEYVKNIF
ncbi:MAG: site-2 protease family protein [Patescibacteria group bacterium]|nr:site-2 protease family protein [Patescibacteria group bacterium]